jgi:hypothetical protein
MSDPREREINEVLKTIMYGGNGDLKIARRLVGFFNQGRTGVEIFCDDDFIKDQVSSYESVFKSIARILCNNSEPNGWTTTTISPCRRRLIGGSVQCFPVRYAFTWWYQPVSGDEAQFRFYSQCDKPEYMLWYFRCHTGDVGSDADTDDEGGLRSPLVLTTNIIEMLHKRVTQLERVALLS